MQPIIKSARTRRRYDFGEYEAVFLDLIENDSQTMVQYEFIIPVFRKGDKRPCLFITSERNDPGPADFLKELGMAESDFATEPDEGSHFLCMFEGDRHFNFGHSNDWSDPGKFEAEALQRLARKLGHRAVITESSV